MKNIQLIIILVFTLSCKAQTPIIPIGSNDYSYPEDFIENEYFKDVNNKFSPFIGTWRWTNGNNTLTIVIEKVEMVYQDFRKSHSYSDYLVGKYKYVENGVEIINTLNYTINANNAWSAHPTYTNFGLTPMLGRYESDSTVNFHFRDYLKNKSEKASFELLDLMENLNGTFTATQARLRLRNSEHWNIDGQNHRDPEFTIPNNIVLIKQ